jgi:hypothetical protein
MMPPRDLGAFRRAFGAHNREGALAGLSWLEIPRSLHHLNIAAVAPYDDAAFVERASELKGFALMACGHNRNAIATQ